MKWENVQNKPTTIEELGITDMESNTQIDKIIDDATIKLTETQSLADTTVEKYSYSNDEQIKKSHTLETGIDNADYKLTDLLCQSLENVYQLLQHLIGKPLL